MAFTWRRLLIVGSLAVILSMVAAMIFVIEGLIVPMAAFVIGFGVGLGILAWKERPGAIFLGVLSIVSLAMSLPFALEPLGIPASTADFVLNLVSVIGLLVVIVAGAAVMRGGPLDDSSGVTLAVGLAFVVVLVGGTAMSITASVARDDPLAQPGDLDLTAKDIEFHPSELVTKPGAVTVFIENEDLTAHTFTIDELDVEEVIPGGASARVVLALESKTYRYYCTIAGHEEMEGELNVAELLGT
ncbi:MAG: cupredoxin domain-containing protein [Actinomycetota bacterium]|nr:cupredoxin domain-containing protein [Actinomycetota bacterium]